MGKVKYILLRKTYNILSSGGVLPKHNYMLRIDSIKLVSLMHHLQEKLHLKVVCLHNFTITGHNFKILPVYESGVKALEGLFKTYKYALTEGEYPVVETTFNDILKLLTMHGESSRIVYILHKIMAW